MLVEVGRGLEAQSRAPSVHIVVREDGVDGTDVDIVGRTGLDGVLEERLDSEDDILHALHVLDAVYELIHGALALGQLDLPVLLPELVVTHLGISLGELFGLALEEFLGYGVKAIVRQTGSAGDGRAAQEAGKVEVCGHVVLGEHPLSVGQFGVLLQYLDIVDEVDVALLGNGHLATTHMERRVLQDVQVASETHVLLVVGQEVEMDARVTLNGERILDVVAIETDTFIADRRDEGILQQADMVLIEVDVREDILQDGIDDVTSLEQMVDPLGGLSHDDGLLRARVTTIDLLRHRLVDTDRKNHLARLGADLHLFHQPGVLLERPRLELFGFQVVQGECNLLVLVILIVVVERQVGLLLRSHHPTHQFHSRIVLTAVLLALGLDGNLSQHMLVGRQFDVETALGLGCHGNDARLIAHSTEGDVPPLMTVDGEATADIGHHSDMMAFVDDTHHGNAVASLSVSDHTPDLLGMCQHYRQ